MSQPIGTEGDDAKRWTAEQIEQVRAEAAKLRAKGKEGAKDEKAGVVPALIEKVRKLQDWPGYLDATARKACFDEVIAALASHQEQVKRLRGLVDELRQALMEIPPQKPTIEDIQKLLEPEDGTPCVIRSDGTIELTLPDVEVALKDPFAREWRPIATAPKNKKVFIGCWIGREWKFGRAELFYERGNEFEGENYEGWFWSTDDCLESIAENPTHWKPLPDPPSEVKRLQRALKNADTVIEDWIGLLLANGLRHSVIDGEIVRKEIDALLTAARSTGDV